MRHAAMVATVALLVAGASAAILPGTWDSAGGVLLTGTWTEIYGPGGPGQPGAALTAAATDGMQWMLGGIEILAPANGQDNGDGTITYTTVYGNADPTMAVLALGPAQDLWVDEVTFAGLEITVLATIASDGSYVGGSFTGSANTASGLVILIEGTLEKTGDITDPQPGHYGNVTYVKVTIVPVELPLDIKPGSCPNAFNPKSKGVLPVALLGSEGFDVAMIDLASIKLLLASDAENPDALYVMPMTGSPGPGTIYEDVAAPFDGEPCECGPTCPDGYLDLALKFRTMEVVSVLGPFDPDTTVELLVTGALTDGTPFIATDCVWVVKGAQTMQVQVQARNAGLGNAVKK